VVYARQQLAEQGYDSVAPYLSFVFTGSNRQYGGDFIQRMQNCLDNLYELIEKYECDADVTIVEWNPPKDRPRLCDAVEFNNSYIQTKIITVPESVHNSIPNPHGEKFFEYWAKNVGIRRATGEFILSTNPDNLYSPELIKRLSEPNLDKNCFYRVNRYDISNLTVNGVRCVSVNYAQGTTIDGYLLDNERANRSPNPLHFNASGDFILMHRDAWREIGGHPEVPYSLTVDGQTVFLAAESGLAQVTLPEPMYHQDHGRTSKHCPSWDDNSPWGLNNAGEWGFAGVEFETRYL
jgi:hypothetical protein